MTVSDVSICNFGLAKLGELPFITNLDDGSKASSLLKVLYEPTRDSLLRAYLWKFARKRVVLAPLTAEPPFDGGNYFQLPDDCIRVIEPGDNYKHCYGRWLREGDRLIANTESLELIYTARITDASKYDPCFNEAFSAKLAYHVAMPLTLDKDLKVMMDKEFRQEIVKAAFVGATEKDSDSFLADYFLQAHS
jgi:hypothetical protein